MTQDNQIDWEGCCIFDEKNKVVGFKIERDTNNFRMRPIPRGERATNEAKQVLAVVRDALKPMTREEFAVFFRSILATYHLNNMAKEDNAALATAYFHDLHKYPVDLLYKAAEKYRKLPDNNAFMPKSGNLIELLTPKYNQLLFLQKRCEQILGIYQAKKLKQNKPISLTEALDSILG